MPAKPSILVYSTQFLTTGGIESHLREFCHHISRSGVDIDLIVLNSGMSRDTEAFFRNTCRSLLLMRAGNPASKIISFSRILFFTGGKNYAALYTNGQGKSIEFLSRTIARKLFWVHHHHMTGDAAERAVWSSTYEKSIAAANELIACTKFSSRCLEDLLRRPVISIPCFSRKIDVPADRPHSQGDLNFGYFGRLIPDKGIDVLRQLAEDPSVTGIKFHIWGEGTKFPNEYFLSHPKLNYHGTFSDAASLAKVLTLLDAFLLISTHAEGLPISLLESMGAGVAWLSTDKGGIPELSCDLHATRIISSDASYEQVRSAVMELAKDIREGRVSRHKQEKLYNENYSSEILTSLWKKTLKIA